MNGEIAQCRTYTGKSYYLFWQNLQKKKVEFYDAYATGPGYKVRTLIDKLNRDTESYYLIGLCDEHEYLTSDEAIRESILADEYEFTEDGTLA